MRVYGSHGGALELLGARDRVSLGTSPSGVDGIDSDSTVGVRSCGRPRVGALACAMGRGVCGAVLSIVVTPVMGWCGVGGIDAHGEASDFKSASIASCGGPRSPVL